MFDLSSIFKGVGAIATAWDVYNQGQAQSAAYTSTSGGFAADEKVYKANEKLEKQARIDAMKRGAQDVADIYDQTAVMEGRQIAAMGASGIAVGGGTFSNLLSDTRMYGRKAAETTWENAKREAEGHRVAAENYKRSAKVAKKNAKTAAKAAGQSDDESTIGAIGSLVGGLASMF